MAGVLREGDEPIPPGVPAAVVFAPSAVSIFTEPPHGSPRNALPVVIAELEPRGELVRVRGDDRHGHLLAADITLGAVAELDLYPGREVIFAVKAAAATLFAI
ncbi:TOBE domain-containing protein [Micropruina sp.]|uniref:TOBE domain-containing protein n=1 Tax=Micropruina sp. TaxID=2737536 RepID=UPI0039E3E177